MKSKLPARTAQRGFTLVEIMVALTIGVFLTGALLTIVQSNRRVFGEQNQLSQLQDNQRMAMTMMADVIQSAAYFPDPVHNSLGTVLPISGPFAAGQGIYGTYSAAPPGDQIQVRYATAGSGTPDADQIISCSGLPNGTAFTQTYVNSFSIVNGQLVCSLTISGGAPTQYTLVGGLTGSGLDITNMTVLYGVRGNATAAGNNVDTYMNAQQINIAALWSSVVSVSITLTFTNPLYAPGNGQQQTIDFTRVIGVMSQTGPTL
jgi:type IV pilus assembly protein PilW